MTTEVCLTPTQEETGQRILDQMKPTTSGLIIFEGLSGVGKTAVLHAIERDVVDAGGVIMPDYKASSPLELPDAKHVVLPSTVRGNDEHIELGISLLDRDPTTMILPGMSHGELLGHPKRLGVSTHEKRMRVLNYCAGIPLLASQIARTTSDSQALVLTAGYMEASFGKTLPTEWEEKTYFGKALPPQLRDALASFDLNKQLAQQKTHETWEYRGLTFDQQLEAKLKKHAELVAAGSHEESPAFVAPESEGIYESMLNTDGISDIHIYAPSMSATELKRAQEAFGYRDWPSEYNFEDATRTKMFNSSEYRKVNFWHRDTDGTEMVPADRYSHAPKSAHEYEAALNVNKFQVPKGNGPASLFVRAREHSYCSSSYHVANLGWMVESFFQQRGIPYFVNNYTYGKSYTYNPDMRYIENVQDLVNVSSY
jgi:hypothetical protein